jgi:hypothetical protein
LDELVFLTEYQRHALTARVLFLGWGQLRLRLGLIIRDSNCYAYFQN